MRQYCLNRCVFAYPGRSCSPVGTQAMMEVMGRVYCVLVQASVTWVLQHLQSRKLMVDHHCTGAQASDLLLLPILIVRVLLNLGGPTTIAVDTVVQIPCAYRLFA